MRTIIGNEKREEILNLINRTKDFILSQDSFVELEEGQYQIKYIKSECDKLIEEAIRLEKSPEIRFAISGLKGDIFKNGWLDKELIQEKSKGRVNPDDLALLSLIIVKDMAEHLKRFVEGEGRSPIEYFLILSLSVATSNKVINNFLTGYVLREEPELKSDIYEGLVGMRDLFRDMLDTIVSGHKDSERYEIYETYDFDLKEKKGEEEVKKLYSINNERAFSMVKTSEKRDALQEILEVTWNSTVSGANKNILLEDGLLGWLTIHYKVH
jgi:hypothetical protein